MSNSSTDTHCNIEKTYVHYKGHKKYNVIALNVLNLSCLCHYRLYLQQCKSV